MSLTQPTVALETTVFTHGLPPDAASVLAETLDRIIRSEGAIPRTIGFLSGELNTDLKPEEILHLIRAQQVRKVSRKDIPIVAGTGSDGGTTVSATMWAAHRTGIRVVATGGIGGVHRSDHEAMSASSDVSADLEELAETPVTVVCSGPKAILDLGATREALETRGVPVVGFQTEYMPAFYCGATEYRVDYCCRDIEEVAAIVRKRDELNLRAAVLVAVLPPKEHIIPMKTVERAIEAATRDRMADGIRAGEITPYLLARIRSEVGEAALTANIELLENNARVAAQLAVELAE